MLEDFLHTQQLWNQTISSFVLEEWLNEEQDLNIEDVNCSSHCLLLQICEFPSLPLKANLARMFVKKSFLLLVYQSQTYTYSQTNYIIWDLKIAALWKCVGNYSENFTTHPHILADTKHLHLIYYAPQNCNVNKNLITIQETLLWLIGLNNE